MSVLRTQLAGAARRPARMLLTGLAVLVASFVVYATVLAQQITERSILDNLSGTPAAVDLVVSGDAVPAADLAKIRALPGVVEANGLAEAGGETRGDYLGITSDPGSGPMSRVQVTEGRYPSKAGEVAVSPRTAERLRLTIGTTLPISVKYDEDGKPLPPVDVTVVGVVSTPEDFGYNGFAPQPLVSALTGDGSVYGVQLRVAPGALESVRAGLLPLVAGKQVQVQTGAEVRQAEAEMAVDDIGELFAVVGMFVAIAVVAAGLVATSTFRIVFAQRMRQLALLRAVGAGRGALTRALAAEGALVGLVVGVTGVALALALGLLLPVIAGAFGSQLASPGFPWLEALGVIALAVVITTVAVLAPALSAGRVAPLEALRTSSTTAGRTGIGWLRWVSGLLPAAGAVAIAAYVVMNLPGRDAKDYDPSPMLLAVVASGALAFIALIALGPVIVRPVLAAIGWPMRRLGPIGKLAVGGVGGAPRRAAAVSVVVALGVTLITGVLVGGASARVLAERESASTVPADFEVVASAEEPMPATLVEQAKARPELANVAPYRRLNGITVGAGTPQENQMQLQATDLAMTALPTLGKLDDADGRWRDLAPGKVVLSGMTGDMTGLRAGDRATLRQGDKTAELVVAAVLPDSAPLNASIVLDPSDLTKLGGPDTYAGLLADASATGEDGRNAGLQALNQLVGDAPNLGVAVLADQRDQINSALNLVLLIAVGLIGLTVLIAVVGVGTTTALSVVERVRESGLLRAVGLSRGGLRTMLTAESGLYGVIGAAVGLLLGVPYAWLAVQAIGVNAPLSVPVGQLAIVFGALVLVTALAGVLPARRAAKVSPVAALGTE